MLPTSAKINDTIKHPSDQWPRLELHDNQIQPVVQYLKDQLIDQYDFMGLTDRMDESLAVMALLWDLEPRDVIVLSSKQSGGYDGGAHEHCALIPKAVTTPKVSEYFETEHPVENVDYLLFAAVNASLDHTIEDLGRERVQYLVQHIQELKQVGEGKCQESAKFPCSSTGVPQKEAAKESCFIHDAGCGHECLDRELQAYSNAQRQEIGQGT